MEPESPRRRPLLPHILIALTLVASGVAAWRYLFLLQRDSNERNASACLKTLATTEADFRANDRDGNKILDFWTGDATGLYHHGKLIDRAIAEADVRPLKPLVPAPVPKAGYLFVALEAEIFDGRAERYQQDTDGTSGKVHHTSRFAYCAYPARYGVTGRWTYVITENNTQFKFDTGGKPILQWPPPGYCTCLQRIEPGHVCPVPVWDK